ncbi:MAG TPA: hypothetical protein PK280_19950 [Planctomycetota bacterium]|nr:hypothetical protein [Planctomycetota bacterium]
MNRTILGATAAALLAGAAWAGEPFDKLRAPSSAEGFEVKLTVEEPAGVARKAEPACGGIPLPAATFKKDQEFKVTSGGKDLPAQVLPLVVDEKGFVRWVLIDTQLDVPAKGKAELVLTTGKSAVPEKPLKVTSGADGASVDTGAAAFTVSKAQPFSLFSTATCGGKKVVGGGSASYTDATDKANPKTYKAAAPTTIEVFEAGPMRATLKVTGGFDGDADTKMRYIAWITAWAGQSRVQVKYILANSHPDQFTFRQIDDSRIALKLEGGAAAGGPGPAVKAGPVSAHDLHFEVRQPRKLEAKDGELLLRGIVPMTEATGKTPWASRSVLLMDSSHSSSFYVVDLAGGDLDARKEADRQRLHIMAPPKWYFDTEALACGKFGTQADEMACYYAWKWTYDAKQAPRRPGNKIPVVRYVHDEDNHYESEQDIVDALVLMYLRTGARDYFTTGEAWANYNMDLQAFRTDGWRFKDGGVWWNKGGPSWGNSPQRAKDPVTGMRNGAPNPWDKAEQLGRMAVAKGDIEEMDRLSDSKQCYCHCYGAGLAGWFCITGERDALEAAIDSVEQNHDGQSRAFKKVPGTSNDFSRDFTRGSYVAHAVRLAAPTDEFVRQASDFLAAVYIKRPNPEPHGFVPAASKTDAKTIEGLTSGKGAAKMQELGIELQDGMLADTKKNRKWLTVNSPGSWMFVYESGALECYYRITGDEDAMDRAIGYGQGAARVLFQTKHSNLAYGGILIDFPTRGFAWDQASWAIPDGVENGEGVSINGYLARFHPDICARAYSLTGEKFLKQRAYDYWWGGSHRGYNATKMHALGGVGAWANINSDHDENVILTGRTFYEWSHPRKDEAAPKAVAAGSTEKEEEEQAASVVSADLENPSVERKLRGKRQEKK